MDTLELALYGALGLGAGALIGCIGIGGVVLVPALAYLGGVPVRAAIAAALCAFLFSGAVGTYVYAKAGSIRWPETLWLSAGAVPAALAGALLVTVVRAAYIELAIGLFTAAAGVHALTGARALRPARPSGPSTWAMTTVGGVTGLVSALTGTGGPLVLLPMLFWLDVPVLGALGLAQVVQLPIAAAATGVNLAAGTLDIGLGVVLGGGIALGSWSGAQAAHALPIARLRGIVAAALIAIGAAIVLEAL